MQYIITLDECFHRANVESNLDVSVRMITMKITLKKWKNSFVFNSNNNNKFI